MLTNLVSMITKSLSSTSHLVPLTKTQEKSNNPFTAGNDVNPFLANSFKTSTAYGKNQPVAGGYFAGYHNGKPNIVGRKLFIEV